MYIRFFLLWIADLIANIIGYCINPILPAFSAESGNLPRWLRWFQTYDATLDGAGADGGIEKRFIAQTVWLRDGTGVPTGRFARYLCRVAWLYRNNAYGFAYSVLGASGPFKAVRQEGNPATSDRAPALAGYCYQVWRNDSGREYFQYRKVSPWGFGKCLEIKIGWKIAADSQQAQLVCRAWPFRAFEA